jgi:Uma2 family endonuclease
MATVTQPARAPSPPAQAKPVRTAIAGDQRIVIRNLSWELYDRLSDAVGERQHIYLAYDGRDLELMTKGWTHEDYKELFSRFVTFVTSELRIRSRPAGETTWKRPEIKRGLEADQCYFFTPDKLRVVAGARARKSKDIADIPNPDLAVEIDISGSQVDRPGIYAALQVTEVWRFDGESVLIERLEPDGSYAAAEWSLFLPLRAEEIYRWVVQEDSNDELGWEDRLREWARTELAPRRKA